MRKVRVDIQQLMGNNFGESLSSPPEFPKHVGCFQEITNCLKTLAQFAKKVLFKCFT